MLKNSDSEHATLDENTLRGIKSCNLPIGKDDFVKGYLDQKKTKITQGFDKISTLLDPDRWPHPEPGIPSQKML